MNIKYVMTHWRETAAFLLTKMHFLSDETFLKWKYWLVFDKKLNLENPQTFNEKIQWLKLHDRRPEYHSYVDKYEVRKYVKTMIGEEYLIPLIGVFDEFDDIDFSTLPNQFVIKCTHDSGSVVVCKDKHLFNIRKCKKKIEKKLNSSLFWWGREWVYKGLTHRIIVEQYMEDKRSSELRDYKLFCFSGSVRFFKVDFNRFINHQANYYDINGNILPFEEVDVPRDPEAIIDLPVSLKTMISMAEKLSNGIPFVRVDFYDVDGRVYFGEMTFYPASGFGVIGPVEWDRKIGDMLILPKEA